MTTLLQKMNMAYASERRFRIESFWDSGFTIEVFLFSEDKWKEIWNGYEIGKGMDILLEYLERK